MNCLHPMSLRDKFGFVKQVPCGRCLACRQNHAKMWALRLRFEMTQHSDGSFLTLTYDDEHLPSEGLLNYPDVQKFFKRLRKDIEPVKVKFFCVGEYGETYGRPHYHVILFGLDFLYDYQSIWPYGFVKAGSVTPASIGYVSGYCVKSDRFGKPFIRCSQGLGLDYFKSKQDDFMKFGMKIDNRFRSVPRYFRDKVSQDLKNLYICRASSVAKRALDRKYRYCSQSYRASCEVFGDPDDEKYLADKEELFSHEKKCF